MKIDKDTDKNIDFHIGKVLEEDIEIKLKNSFLNYSMSVITSRALPDIRDGLKPIHRRIIYSMYQIKLFPNSSFKKSAKIVGEVIAKYHPHGDASVYGTLVRMAQDFNYRYPFIIPQGNFGSVDGDSPAAMRYTEAKMSNYSMKIIEDIEYDTVNFVNNYDNTEKEPTVLPSRLPNLLLNGSDGIAVGMATSIPPHNIVEVINALLYIIDYPNCLIDEILNLIPGPDFPTGAQILDNKKLKDIYKNGRGSVLIRSKYHIENKNDKVKRIVFTEIPYFVNKSSLVENIAESISKKNSYLKIKNIRDESSRFGIRIVVEIDNNESEQLVIKKLYKETQLQTYYHCKFLALVNNSPVENLNIKTILSCYLEHQRDVIKRRTRFFIKRDERKENIASGILIASKHTDKVIKIIKGSINNADALKNLKKELLLNEIQAKAILEMRLTRLTSVENKNLVEEISNLQKQIKINKDILSSKDSINNQIKKELLILKDKNKNNVRKTELIEFDGEIGHDQVIVPRDFLVIISSTNMIKAIPIEEFKIQNRSGVGVKSSNLYDDDNIMQTLCCNNTDKIYAFTNKGNVFSCFAFQIPESSRISKGTAAINIFPKLHDKSQKIIKIIAVKKGNFESFDDLLLLTHKGKIKKTNSDNISRVNVSGKKIINIESFQDHIVNSSFGKKHHSVFIISDIGKAVHFDVSKLRYSGRTAYGVAAIKTHKQRPVDFTVIEKDTDNVLLVSELGYGKVTPISLFPKKGRNISGMTAMKINKKTGNLLFSKRIMQDSVISITTTKGKTIIIPYDQLPIFKGRATSGVKIISLKTNEYVSSVNIFEKGIINKSDERDI